MAPVDAVVATGTADYAFTALTAFLLMLAFRVWDDLEDRSRDAREHPSRVTVVADSVAPLSALALVLGTLGVLSVALGPRRVSRLAAVSIAVAVLAAWYRTRPVSTRAVVDAHVVLLKYPLPRVCRLRPRRRARGRTRRRCYLGALRLRERRRSGAPGIVVARWVAISELALLVSADPCDRTLFRGRNP